MGTSTLWGVIISGLLGVLTTLIYYKFEQTDLDIKDLRKSQDVIKKEMEEFRINYLDRFERVHSDIGKTKFEIMEKLHEIALKIK